MTAEGPVETQRPSGYGERRAKDKVADPAFARTFGLLESALMQFSSRLPGEAGIAAEWAVLELTDYSELEPEDQVGYDLSGRGVLEVLEEVRAGVAGLAQDSTDLVVTLRYLRAEAYVSEASAVVASSAAGTTGTTGRDE